VARKNCSHFHLQSTVPNARPGREAEPCGDEQSDLSVHGGVDKAIYAYPSEHYDFWRNEFPELDFPWGAFGENLTVEGLLEEKVYVGDRLRAGSAEFVVTQPQNACFKLGIRFNRRDMVKRFPAEWTAQASISRVLREGECRSRRHD
jgi:MOSC domain-containing protein YiiM